MIDRGSKPAWDRVREHHCSCCYGEKPGLVCARNFGVASLATALPWATVSRMRAGGQILKNHWMRRGCMRTFQQTTRVPSSTRCSRTGLAASAGRSVSRFLETPAGARQGPPYVVDNSNLGDLLRLIAG